MAGMGANERSEIHSPSFLFARPKGDSRHSRFQLFILLIYFVAKISVCRTGW